MALSEAEKEAELAPFVKPQRSTKLPGRPLNAAERKQWNMLRGNRGRGKGTKIVPISIERELLKEADAFARDHQLKWSQMIADALRLLMRRAKAG